MEDMIPARRVLTEAEETNRRLGHENLGFLSASHGFLPIEPPRLTLPESHHAWDEVAAELPELFRTVGLRRRLDHMPILSGVENELPDGDLYRAAAILGIFSHAYHYVEPAPYTRIPDSILKPWAEISRRLHRPAPHLSFIDLNIYNWRLKDASLPDPMQMENLRLLIPIVGNEDERRFQCTPIEIVARFTPLLTSVIRAQEAASQDDRFALKQELILLSDSFHNLTHTSLMKVNPNAYHPSYIDPVVWGKTVAPLATPFQEGNAIPGPSGTAIPTFTLMDIFFGRLSFSTTVGHETERTRAWFPPHWQKLLKAAEQISVPGYVKQVRDSELTGLFQQALDSYSGETGLIGRHRLKAYGFLDLSFKAGRSRTLGGFEGGFEDRLWDRMDDELERARQERYVHTPATCHFVRVKQVEQMTGAGVPVISRVTLDTSGTGIRYQPGDRCAILPENDPQLVQQTLSALHATGDEPIPLNTVWRTAVQYRDGYQDAVVLSLRTLLTFGRIRPIARDVAKTLLASTHNDTLHQIIEARAEDQWELWDLLKVLAEGGFNPKRLWKATLGEREHITRIVPPETFRTYSISSRMTDQEANELQLTIVRLRYQTRETPVSRATLRTGTGSGFLRRLGASSGVKARRISIKIIHPPHFSLPVDASRPVVMFAGGTGIAPFRSLLQARVSQQAGGENWLFFGTRTRSELYYQPEWERFIAERHLNLQTIFSREDGRLTTRNGQLVFTEGARGRIDQVMLTPETDEMLWKLIQQGAFFYVCGRTGFAKRVMKTLQKIITHHVGDDQARQFFYRLVGEGRYLQEVFTTYAGPQLEQAMSYPASEVVLHNNPEAGYWFIINGRVYDVSEFAHLHPGGLKIIQSYAGMDATISYKKAQHDINPEVDSLLGMYQLGAVRRLSFGSGGGIAITPRGLQFVSLTELYQTWIHFLYMVVEMENALLNDYSIRTEQVTYDETRGKPRSSRYRMQLLLQTHERFLHGYLARVSGRALEHLWALTSGLCSDHQDYRWMQKQIADIEASASAQAARALGMQAQSLLNNAASDRLAELEQLTDRLSETNREFLEQMKLGLRQGVQVFETFEKHTITQGRAQLLEAIGSIPHVLTGYYEKLNLLS
ncbi:MAG TPA: cytochrome b5 domain-containing protein [Anaerolineales bacterium]|nr:cytochrome b5 domain-containing protein [Anaerolineales bacterium]